MYEELHLRSSINFAFHKFKPSTLTVGTVKSNFKGKIERFIADENTFTFMSSIKGTTTYWKELLHVILTMVKQLGTPRHFLTFSCAEQKREELPYILLTN